MALYFALPLMALYSPCCVHRAIYEALHMPEEERIERHTNMAEYVSKFTIQHWADNFVAELQSLYLPASSSKVASLLTICLL